MLYKLVIVYGAKPLAFTFNHPFESRNAVHNIERVIEKLGVEHICMTPNINIYKKMMKKIFTMDRGELVRIAKEYGMRAEKMPCVGCTNLMQMYAFIITKKFEIPYLIYCADPIQMTGVDYDINRVFSVLKRICGEDLLFSVSLASNMQQWRTTETCFPLCNNERLLFSEDYYRTDGKRVV